MSSQIVRERPLVGGLSGGKTANWLKLSSKKLLSRKKQLMLGITGAALLGLAAFYFFGNQAGTTQYLTARVERGNLRNTVTATGTLQAVTTVQVGSQASGTISALFVDFNSVVKKGQIVAQLDPAVSKAQVDSRPNQSSFRWTLFQVRTSTERFSRCGSIRRMCRTL